ncbi:MAG: hypothetical protein ACK5LJ_13320 [Paracoccus sp. (in: a-proteobacteria)]
MRTADIPPAAGGLIEIARAWRQPEAHLAAALLHSAGIAAVVSI